MHISQPHTHTGTRTWSCHFDDKQVTANCLWLNIKLTPNKCHPNAGAEAEAVEKEKFKRMAKIISSAQSWLIRKNCTYLSIWIVPARVELCYTILAVGCGWVRFRSTPYTVTDAPRECASGIQWDHMEYQTCYSFGQRTASRSRAPSKMLHRERRAAQSFRRRPHLINCSIEF